MEAFKPGGCDEAPPPPHLSRSGLEDVGGTMAGYGQTAAQSGAIYADATSNLAVFNGYATSASNSTWMYTFTYRIK